ncbi:MAG: transposase zinc-binding domain-containing protein [Deltaproteobacteria bacterium]|nr:transposase zinc-binding domain-containing protein [Deltaproteobacteria bacterium]
MLGSPQTEPGRPYRPRAPALGFLHRIVREHLPAFRELRPDLPRHVVEALEGYLDCGILSNGFSRLRCGGCGHEQLLPFSCKGRLCPSCQTRKMYETAAHLVDRVLPPAPYRQFVLALPRRQRYLLVTRPELVSPVHSVVVRSYYNWQRLQARRLGVRDPLCCSLTCIQRIGDALNLNVHFHSFLPDGVYTREGDTGPMIFHPLPAPTPRDLDELVLKVWRRVGRKLKALGAWEPEVEDELDVERLELGRAVGEQLFTPGLDDEVTFERKGLSAFHFGYSLHAGVAVGADDRDGLAPGARTCSAKTASSRPTASTAPPSLSWPRGPLRPTLLHPLGGEGEGTRLARGRRRRPPRAPLWRSAPATSIGRPS